MYIAIKVFGLLCQKQTPNVLYCKMVSQGPLTNHLSVQSVTLPVPLCSDYDK